jgi:hypothetical protein
MQEKPKNGGEKNESDAYPQNNKEFARRGVTITVSVPDRLLNLPRTGTVMGSVANIVLKLLKGLISIFCKQELPILLGVSNLGRDKNPYGFPQFRSLRQNLVQATLSVTTVPIGQSLSV